VPPVKWLVPWAAVESSPIFLRSGHSGAKIGLGCLIQYRECDMLNSRGRVRVKKAANDVGGSFLNGAATPTGLALVFLGVI
jgi:hypothetical protein